MRERVLFILIVLSLLIYPDAKAQSSSIKGIVIDQKTGETLIGATIMIEGTTKGTITDFDGNYSLDNLEPGTYTVLISFVSYSSQLHEEIDVREEQATILNIKLEEATTKLDEVKVIGRANRESMAMLLVEQKEATVIKESIGAQQLSNMGVSDAATATTKISGVTKTEGSGDIFVRGLGDRYLSTTLNNLPIPSDDIDKKNINLNLFSTDVISNVGISKTYTVANFADLTSGNVDIGSKILTRDKLFEIGIEGGINNSVITDGIFDNFRASQNYNDISYLGFYNKPYETEESITKQSWNPVNKNLPVNHELSFIAGKKFSLFGKELSLLATASHSNSSEYNEGTYTKYRMNSINKSFNDVEVFKSKIRTTGLLNLNYDFNINHSIGYNFLYVHKTEDELYEQGRNKEGYIRDFEPNQYGGVFVRDQNSKETYMFINQLIGKHTLNEYNELKWALGYSKVIADEPNRFRNETSYNSDLDRWQFGFVSNFHVKKSYQEIEDDEINGYIIDEISFIDEERNKLKLFVGGNFRVKNRSFGSLARGVRAMPDLVNFTSIDNMDEALLDQNLYDNGALRIDNTLPKDLFDATLYVYAGYADLAFDKGNISGSFGIRYELDQILSDWDVNNYFDIVNGVARIGSISNTYSNVYPALNLKYQIANSSAVRFAASKTITLPEFKEISPFEYVSPEGDVTKGNEKLKNSDNYNADLKWELYPSPGELLSVTGFYKLINDPINLALTRGSSGNFRYDNTGEKATAYGFEVEGRLSIIKSSGSNKPGLSLLVNATRMWFKQDLLEYFQYDNKTESGLEGASELIFNSSLYFTTNSKNKFDATVTANYSSDKIFALGAPESQGDKLSLFNSEIIEKGFTTLDLVLSQKLSNRVSLKFKARNLLNPTIERTQYIKPTSEEPNTVVVKSYKKGINLSLGVTINLN